MTEKGLADLSLNPSFSAFFVNGLEVFFISLYMLKKSANSFLFFGRSYLFYVLLLASLVLSRQIIKKYYKKNYLIFIHRSSASAAALTGLIISESTTPGIGGLGIRNAAFKQNIFTSPILSRFWFTFYECRRRSTLYLKKFFFTIFFGRTQCPRNCKQQFS